MDVQNSFAEANSGHSPKRWNPSSIGDITGHKWRWKASTLVEVLVALTILMTVFAVGMLIFANLSRSGRTQRKQVVFYHLRDVAQGYRRGDIAADESLIRDSTVYFMEESVMPNLADRKKVGIYAFDPVSETILDSLIFIHEEK